MFVNIFAFVATNLYVSNPPKCDRVVGSENVPATVGIEATSHLRSQTRRFRQLLSRKKRIAAGTLLVSLILVTSLCSRLLRPLFSRRWSNRSFQRSMPDTHCSIRRSLALGCHLDSRAQLSAASPGGGSLRFQVGAG
jgi:hypothetical protein